MAKDKDAYNNYFQLEMTGLYTGVYTRNELYLKGEKKTIGGGYIESFAYDSEFPKLNPSNPALITADVRNIRHQFTLSDVIGISGAAPQKVFRPSFHLKDIGFPEHLYWPVDLTSKAKEYPHGDGGHIDNLGLMPLLLRKVENIIVFVNTKTPFELNSEKNKVLSIAPWIKKYFISNNSKNNVKNAVFKYDKYIKLEEGLLNKKKKDEPLAYCDHYKIIPNSQYGVESYDANICWVYLDRNEKWLDLLPERTEEKGVTRALVDSAPPFDKFPHYSTFGENLPFVIDLNTKQINAMSQLSSWTLCKAREEIVGNFDSELANILPQTSHIQCD